MINGTVSVVTTSNELRHGVRSDLIETANIMALDYVVPKRGSFARTHNAAIDLAHQTARQFSAHCDGVSIRYRDGEFFVRAFTWARATVPA